MGNQAFCAILTQPMVDFLLPVVLAAGAGAGQVWPTAATADKVIAI